MAAFDDAVVEDGFSPRGYRIIGELDRGGMAVVYHAKQLNPEREVALKVMLPKFSGEREMRTRFQTEARAMAALEHPAIMPIYEVGESERLPFFSMKLAERGSLAVRISNSKPEIKQVVDWMIEVAGAVHYAHQQGVLHRDLKPGNFLFDDRGQIYVSDFGVAKMMLGGDGGVTRTEAFVGTPNYMPPELAGGVATQASVSGDLYSLGAVFYECLTGIRPHGSHTNVASLLRAIVDEKIPSPRSVNSQVPVDLDVICTKALEGDSQARYSSVNTFRQDLIRWKEGHAIMARPVGLGGTLWRWARRHPLSASLAMGIISVTVGAGIYIGLQSYQIGQQNEDLERQYSLQNGLLYEQYLGNAKFERLIGKSGFRARAFRELSLSANLGESPEIRNQAAALLTRMDVKVEPFEGSDAKPEFLRSNSVNDFQFSADKELVISEGADGRSTLWDVKSGKVIREWFPAYGQVVQAAFTGDQILVVGADDNEGNNDDLSAKVRLFSGEGYEIVEEINLPKDESFLFFSMSPDGKIAAMNGQRGLFLLEMESKKVLWYANKGAARCEPAWSPDGRTIAAALGDENKIFFFDVTKSSGSVFFTASRFPSQLLFHPEGRLLAALQVGTNISLIDVFKGKEIFELPVNSPGHLQFSKSGDRFWVGDGKGKESAWKIESPVGYHEWQRRSIFRKNTTVFDLQISPDDQYLLTVTADGVELWSFEDKRQIGFYGSENQRIDVRSSAWWLSENEILLQVPGGLEVIGKGADGALSFLRRVRVPGARVTDVDFDGNWWVDQLDEEGMRTRVVWPKGRVEDEQLESSLSLTKGSPNELMTKGEIEEGKTIRLEGKYDFVLTPADSVELIEARFQRSQEILVAVSSDGRVMEWNLEVLIKQLKELGF